MPLSRVFAAVAILLGAGFGCGPPESGDRGAPSISELNELGSVGDFQARFDADSALPRLVLLLSPS